MDVSETYIRMCDLAMRYLPPHKFIYGDIYSDDGVTAKVVLLVQFPVANCIPLLRQDQLQELVYDGSEYQAGNLLCHFRDLLSQDKWNTKSSMEQIWLMFVMKKKYQRTWVGEDWKEVVYA